MSMNTWIYFYPCRLLKWSRRLIVFLYCVCCFTATASIMDLQQPLYWCWWGDPIVPRIGHQFQCRHRRASRMGDACSAYAVWMMHALHVLYGWYKPCICCMVMHMLHGWCVHTYATWVILAYIHMLHGWCICCMGDECPTNACMRDCMP